MSVGSKTAAESPAGFDPGRPAGSFATTTREVLLHPARFFAAVRGEATFAGPVLYALACHALAVLFAGAYDFALAVGAGTVDDITVLETEGVAGGVLWILFLLGLTPLYVLGVLFVGAAIYQLLVRLLVGKRNAGYGATLRVTAYLSAVALLVWMPVLGLLIGPWGVWINAVGLRRFHATTTTRAVLVATVPYVLALSWSVFSVASGNSTFWEFVLGGGTMYPTEKNPL